MSGVETTASVIEFLRCVKTCLDFYQEARLNTPQHHHELRLRLEVEAITFDRWCANVGVNPTRVAGATGETVTDASWHTSNELKRLQACLEESLRFNSPLTADLVINVLKGLGAKFEEARNRLQTGSGVNDNSASAKAPSRWKLWSQRKLSVNQPGAIQKGTIGFFATSKWLLWDKKYFNQLLSELTSINESLVKLLNSARRAQVQRQVNLQVLGTSGSAVLPTAQRLSFDRPNQSLVGTLATIKQANIDENAGDAKGANEQQAKSNASDQSRVPTYQIDELDPDVLKVNRSRVVTSLHHTPVLVEWRSFSKTHPLRFEQIIRLGSLVNLLNRQEIYNEFHIPRCRGLVKDDSRHRIGLVFDIPITNSTQPAKYCTLQKVIASTRGKPIPSNTDRLAIALRLAVALHYLQSVHWLHKSLRSDNVVCFRDVDLESFSALPEDDTVASQDAKPPVLDSNRKVEQPQELDDLPSATSFPDFYLLGLDLSRPDHPQELTESISISTSDYRQDQENIELYTHPEALKRTETGSKPRYHAKFDIYSLGLILLEVGLWRTLHDIQKRSNIRGAEYRTQIETKYCNQLRSAMGNIYWRVTRRCLLMDFDLTELPPGTEPSFALQLAFEKQVVSELARCTS